MTTSFKFNPLLIFVTFFLTPALTTSCKQEFKREVHYQYYADYMERQLPDFSTLGEPDAEGVLPDFSLTDMPGSEADHYAVLFTAKFDVAKPETYTFYLTTDDGSRFFVDGNLLIDDDGARGDQCDNCGNELDPTDLVDPVSKINGEKPRFEETKHFFLDLPALAEANVEWLKTRKNWRTNVMNFSMGLFREVKPRAITRDIDWGIPIPVDGWIDNPNKRLYVWFDAVIGYLSASVEWARRKGDPEAWREWWNNPQAPGYYFMGGRSGRSRVARAGCFQRIYDYGRQEIQFFARNRHLCEGYSCEISG